MIKIKQGIAVLLFTLLFPMQSFAQKIVVAYDADPVSLDPHEQLSGATLQISHMIFDPLIRFDNDMTLEPRLATHWESINETTMRFYLRKGVKFHSGNPFTADDVIWTFNRLKTSVDFKGIFSQVSKAEKIDDYTVDFITNGPYPLLENIATYIFPMDRLFYTGKTKDGLDKSLLNKHNSSYAATHTSGTGAFFIQKREQGIVIEFERFKQYWDKNAKGNVSHITLRPIKEEATRVAALISGDVDMIAPISPNDYRRIEKQKDLQLVTLPGSRVITFALNQKMVPEFKDARVRQAVVYAINNQAIAKKVMKGAGVATSQLSSPLYAGYNPNLPLRYNLKKTKL